MSEVKNGEVVWFNDKLGFGFVKPDDGGQDMFCHYTNIVAEEGKFRTLTAGQRVSYTVGSNNTGPQAENIVILEEPDLLE
jgi:CspA family cold shock protein